MRFTGVVKGLLLILTALTLFAGCQTPVTGGYPVSPTYSYVIPTTTYLRDCPGYQCGVVTEIYSGDRVVVLDRNPFGWARVQLERTGALAELGPGNVFPATSQVGESLESALARARDLPR